jgi:hypothetical protein
MRIKRVGRIYRIGAMIIAKGNETNSGEIGYYRGMDIVNTQWAKDWNEVESALKRALPEEVIPFLEFEEQELTW